MARLQLSARGKAPAAVAWERYADPARWPGWASQLQRVSTSMTRIHPGGTGTVHAGLLPVPTLPVAFEVLAVDEAARTWEWQVRLGPLRLRLEHGVSDEANGSSTWVRLHGPLPVLLAYAPIARIAIGRLVAG